MPQGDAALSALFSRDRGLGEKLRWVSLGRLILVTVLFGSAIAFNINNAESFTSDSYRAISALIVASYLGTIGLSLAIRKQRWLGFFSWATALGDIGLAACLVFLTQGTESIFLFLFVVVIFSAAILQGRRGAFVAAVAASLSLLGIATLQRYGIGLGDVRPTMTPTYTVVVHVGSFFVVAWLAGYLSEKLGQIDLELQRRKLDLARLRALHENIVKSVPTGLVTLDDSGRVLLINPAAQRLFELTDDDVFGRPILAMFPPLHAWVDRIRESNETSGRTEIELEFGRQRKVVDVSLSRLQGASVTGLVLALDDRTELRALELAMKQQEHLSAIGKLSTAIAHEIRNPLASISGSIEMLAMLLDPPPDERQLMNIVTREVDRLNGLINEFLDYARPPRLDLRPTDVGDLVEGVIQMVQTGGVDATIGLARAESDVTALADDQKLRQIVWNLIRNAVQAAGSGGRVDVTVEPHDDGSIGHATRIRVADSGKGISQDALDHLFEPFFTTKPGGTGLGLATCHRIVGLHGGRIEARNVPGAGAEFTVLLRSASEGVAEGAFPSPEKVAGNVPQTLNA